MFGDLTHPDDLARVMTQLQKSIEGKAVYDIEMRILRPDRSVRLDLVKRETFERDELGKPLHMRGTALDITERKRWEESLKQTNDVLEKKWLYAWNSCERKKKSSFKSVNWKRSVSWLVV